jgi:poly(hydroxyalkanoate) granule-associated protein
MVKKIDKSSGSSTAGNGGGKAGSAQLAGTIKDSAQQIWLAGLGAFAKAQEEGTKVFDALVKEGVTLQKKTQAVAEEKITEATSRMASMATDISSKASGQWDKLETIFEERVSRSLKKLGVPTAREVDALMAQVEELKREVARMGGKSAAAKPAAKAAPAKKAAAKKAPARKRSAAKSGA